MDPNDCPIDMLACMIVILLLVLDAKSALLEGVATSLNDIIPVNDIGMIPTLDRSSLPFDALCQAALNHFQIWSSNMCLDEDLGFWVKPRSTMWFPSSFCMSTMTHAGLRCSVSLNGPSSNLSPCSHQLFAKKTRGIALRCLWPFKLLACFLNWLTVRHSLFVLKCLRSGVAPFQL